MKAPGCSSIWRWTLFVICGLFVIAHANINNDDDEWIDPYDMLNYDPTAKRMRKPTEAASYTNVPTKRREFSSDSCELPKCPDVSECMFKLSVLQKEAITVTITSFITDPLKHIGQGISEFLRALLKDLPFTLQIPVLLVIAGAIFVFMYGSAYAAIQHAIPWPRLGGRRDPPPPAVEQRHAPRLRENEYWAGGDAPQPLQDPHRNNINHVRNRVNHGFGAGEANANAPQPNQEGIRTPQPRDGESSMDILEKFVGRPGDVQTVRVETLRSTGNMSSQNDVDCQQRTLEQDPVSPKLLYIYWMIMRVLSCSSFGFWSLFVFCELYVFTYANSNQGDAWINLDDMINYDPRTKSMRIPTEKACTTVQQPTCLPVFKRLISRLLKETTKLGLPDGAKTFMHYDAEVKLSRQMVSEFQKLLKDDKDWKNGALDEALSQFLVNFRLSDHKPWTWRFEETFHVEVDTALKLSLCVLVITAAICTEMWSVVSWFIQFKRIVLICFFISLIWNWLHLYMLAFAEHQKNIVVMERLREQCTGMKEMTWWDSLLEWYRRTFTLQDDPCKIYYETVLVNPILLVPPTKAFIVTLTYLFTDPLKHIGQGINEFLRALLKDLPVFLQIPVFLTIAAPFLVFTCGSALGGVIKHAAVLLPWLGEHPAAPGKR
ncbi:chloride channel CLIC-like protein 1 [Triplophysa rosa]|uniref:chloride channel CLIC-like protein 1 n=1 Tax=Triplophysa rosa TaxID=992332 RepID=UPI002545C5F9|nr:chloride channel CLIC-like protein 1 [Triplophysa rosa]